MTREYDITAVKSKAGVVRSLVSFAPSNPPQEDDT